MLLPCLCLTPSIEAALVSGARGHPVTVGISCTNAALFSGVRLCGLLLMPCLGSQYKRQRNTIVAKLISLSYVTPLGTALFSPHKGPEPFFDTSGATLCPASTP